MVHDLESSAGSQAGLDPPVDRLVEIKDLAAGEAAKLEIALKLRVKAGKVALRQLCQQPLLDEELQVPIDRPEADAGNPLLDLSMHPVGRRMAVRAADHLEDHPALVRETPSFAAEAYDELRVHRPLGRSFHKPRVFRSMIMRITPNNKHRPGTVKWKNGPAMTSVALGEAVGVQFDLRRSC